MKFTPLSTALFKAARASPVTSNGPRAEANPKRASRFYQEAVVHDFRLSPLEVELILAGPGGEREFDGLALKYYLTFHSR